MGMVIPFFFWKIKAMFETTKQMGLFIRCWPKKTNGPTGTDFGDPQIQRSGATARRTTPWPSACVASCGATARLRVPVVKLSSLNTCDG